MNRLSRYEMLTKMKHILLPEKSFYIISIIYGIGVSLLSLAAPISVQSLVNNVAFTVLTQPLVFLSIVLLTLLIFSGALNALQTYIIELFQQHFYARTTSEIAVKLINSNNKELVRRNGTELVNRYFDIMTVQKSMATLFSDGIGIILQTIVGTIILAFYHPYFLVFDVILVSVLYLVWALFRKNALESAVDESKAKYETANWLKEIARENLFFKSRTRKAGALRTSDRLINKYLKYRKFHFSQVFYQTIFLLSIYAFMSAIALGLGGYLVMKGELTLGQLVAAELIVTAILGNFAKAGKYLEGFYDLYAAVDKISQIYDLPSEENCGRQTYKFDNYDLRLENAELEVNGRSFKYNFDFKHGEKYLIHSKYNSSKLVFLDLIRNLAHNKRGQVKLGNYTLEEISPLDIRDLIQVIDLPAFFDGTIMENLTLGKPEITRSQVINALEIVDMTSITDVFEEGLQTQILPSGYPLWPAQHFCLELARAILLEPKILVLTELFDLVDAKRREKIIKHFLKLNTTVIVFSHREDCEDMDFDHFVSLTPESIKAYKNHDELVKALR